MQPKEEEEKYYPKIWEEKYKILQRGEESLNKAIKRTKVNLKRKNMNDEFRE